MVSKRNFVGGTVADGAVGWIMLLLLASESTWFLRDETDAGMVVVIAAIALLLCVLGVASTGDSSSEL